MFHRQINQDTKTYITIPQYAEELFELTDRNRSYLKKWLPWLDSVNNEGDTREFIRQQIRLFGDNKALHATIFYKDQIAGVVAFNTINSTNRTGNIGYWLGKEYSGKGIMISCVKDFVGLGFEILSLQKIVIRCALENKKSRAIPERLGFKNEGVLRRAENVYGHFFDHVIYGLLREEFKSSRTSKS